MPISASKIAFLRFSTPKHLSVRGVKILASPIETAGHLYNSAALPRSMWYGDWIFDRTQFLSRQLRYIREISQKYSQWILENAHMTKINTGS